MKRLSRLAIATRTAKGVLSLIAVLAVLPSTSFAQTIIIQNEPPPIRTEMVPVARPGYVWDHGHWAWTGREYQWIPGHWQPEMRGARWEPGHWSSHGREWHWDEGHWVR